MSKDKFDKAINDLKKHAMEIAYKPKSIRMEENQYVIISKTAIQKRIDHLKKKKLMSSEVKELKRLLSQSTPLIPEIEKAYNAGKLDEELSNTFDNPKSRYISNLKLDI